MELEHWDDEENSIAFEALKTQTFVPNKLQLFRRHASDGSNSKTLPIIHCNLMLWVCLKGPGAFYLDGVKLFLKTNECFFLLPGQRHKREYLEDSDADWLLIRFGGENQNIFDKYKNMIFKIPTDGQKLLKDIVKKYIIAKSNPTEINKHLSILEFAKLIAQIPLYVMNTNFNKNDDVNIEKLINDPKWNLSGAESIDDIAEKMGVTSKYLRTLYRKSIGRTPMQVRQIMRTYMAVNLMTHSNQKIKDISEQLGFKSVYSFSRFFKNETGFSPLNYRKEQLKEKQ